MINYAIVIQIVLKWCIIFTNEPKVSIFSPLRTPGILDQPIVNSIVGGAISDKESNVVWRTLAFSNDTTRVMEEVFSSC